MPSNLPSATETDLFQPSADKGLFQLLVEHSSTRSEEVAKQQCIAGFRKQPKWVLPKISLLVVARLTLKRDKPFDTGRGTGGRTTNAPCHICSLVRVQMQRLRLRGISQHRKHAPADQVLMPT